MAALVLYEVKDRVGYITLNRPEKRNALSFEFVQEIKTTFLQAQADENCKVLVLQGSGEAFCAGADLAYLQQLQNYSETDNLNDSKNLMELFSMIYRSPKIVISKVNGPALAGGCGLATVCDFCFATPESSFGYTEVKIGFVPAMVMVFLVRKVSEKIAREILLTGDVFNAEKALYYQLIHGIIPSEKINDEVHAYATKLCKTTSAQSVAMIKQMLSDVQEKPLQEALEFAAQMNVTARTSNDCKKGISAFLNKEKISW